MTRIGMAGVLAIAMTLAALALLGHSSSQAASERQIDREVNALLAGIPQQGQTLGKRSAPVTLEVHADLKDPDSRNWFLLRLPAILQDDVRPGLLKIEYLGFKTNTYHPQEFVKEQTAALAAGAQNKLWQFVETFFYERHSEFDSYVSPKFVENIAAQIPGLHLTQWHTDLHTNRREEQAAQEDLTARTTLGLHVTPSFRIGSSGGPLKDFSGHAIIKYGEQHPISLIEAKDINQVIKELHLSH